MCVCFCVKQLVTTCTEIKSNCIKNLQSCIFSQFGKNCAVRCSVGGKRKDLAQFKLTISQNFTGFCQPGHSMCNLNHKILSRLHREAQCLGRVLLVSFSRSQTQFFTDDQSSLIWSQMTLSIFVIILKLTPQQIQRTSEATLFSRGDPEPEGFTANVCWTVVSPLNSNSVWMKPVNHGNKMYGTFKVQKNSSKVLENGPTCFSLYDVGWRSLDLVVFQVWRIYQCFVKYNHM